MQNFRALSNFIGHLEFKISKQRQTAQLFLNKSDNHAGNMSEILLNFPVLWIITTSWIISKLLVVARKWPPGNYIGYKEHISSFHRKVYFKSWWIYVKYVNSPIIYWTKDQPLSPSYPKIRFMVWKSKREKKEPKKYWHL